MSLLLPADYCVCLCPCLPAIRLPYVLFIAARFVCFYLFSSAIGRCLLLPADSYGCIYLRMSATIKLLPARFCACLYLYLLATCLFYACPRSALCLLDVCSRLLSAAPSRCLLRPDICLYDVCIYLLKIYLSMWNDEIGDASGLFVLSC